MFKENYLLLCSIFVAGLCSIIYELLIATTSAYFQGDSVTQFSLTIGVYMAFMGVGSYLSRFIGDKTILAQFIGFEALLALLGGLSVPLIYLSYSLELSLTAVALSLTAIIGTLVGLEIPLLSRLMERHYSLKANLANVLSIDYLGALIATLLFPFFFLPLLGVFKTSLAFGLTNLTIAVALLWYFQQQLPKTQRHVLKSLTVMVFIVLASTMLFSHELNKRWNAEIFEDRVIHSEQSQYQQLVLTRYKQDLRLYLNGNLQFSAIDEYRYHESLIHPAMNRLNHQDTSILLIGGGDGLAARELLKYSQVSDITIVDLDPAVARLAKTNNHISHLNKNALLNPKVNIVHEDAFVYINENSQLYDLIVVDLPDPKTVSLARLYSQQFYRLVKRQLKPMGIFVTQATSPFFAKDAFWSIHNTIKSIPFVSVTPYHADIPSFGNWGFVLACNWSCAPTRTAFKIETRFYRPEIQQALETFSADISNTGAGVSSLDKPKVMYYYLDGWKYWN